MPRTVPIYVRLPNLPLHCWGSQTLGKISSGLGKPMHSDERTRTQSRISYARVLVDMNVTQVMPDKISIADPTNRVFE